MKLGIMLSGRTPEHIHEKLEQAREAGFSLCQLNLQQGGFTRADLASVAESLVEFGIRTTAVGCYVNPLRPDAPGPVGVRRADLATLLQSLDIIGARRVVFWSGTHADALFAPHSDNGSDESLQALNDFLVDVVSSTHARHYFLVLEPWHTHVLADEERIIAFHENLPDAVAERVRYVMDPAALLTEQRYDDRDKHVQRVCRAIGEAAGVVHLRDCVMPPDGETSYPAPGLGKLDYPAYVDAVLRSAAPDAPAIIRNVPATEMAAARDFMLRQSDRWELA